MRPETIRFLNKTFVPCRPARTISRECSSSMRSRDHVLHDLAACRLQWPHAASGQEPNPFVFVSAMTNIDDVAGVGVVVFGSVVLGSENTVGYDSWFIG